MAATEYNVGIPVHVTVQDDGSVILIFDLSDIGRSIERDAEVEYPESLVAADAITVNVAADSIGNTHTLTIA